jgi:hypothetical protein
VLFDETRWGAMAAILPGAGFWSGAECTLQIVEGDIQQLSIEQLGNVEITSISNTPQVHSMAAADVHAISHGDLICANTNVPSKLLVLIDGRSFHCETRLRF